MNTIDALCAVFIGLIVVAALVLVQVVVFSTFGSNGTVIAINPDKQISYVNVVVQMKDGNTFTESISCTGNFQFQVGQRVQYQGGPVLWWQSYVIWPLPSGCSNY